MLAANVDLSVDPPAPASDLENVRNEFHALVNALTDEDLKRKTVDTLWTVGEILEHMVNSIELIPQEIDAVRKGKNLLNYPPAIVRTGNFILTKIRARNCTRQSILARYDRFFSAATEAWKSVREEEWSKGADFFGEGHRTLADNHALVATHFKEHAEQILRSLPRERSAK